MTRVAIRIGQTVRTALVSAAVFQMTLVAPLASADNGRDHAGNGTATPIKHVIVIIGENRSFDHVFATYKPRKLGETVWNLLSRGIINEQGGPGPNAVSGFQYSAENADTFRLSPGSQALYPVLPAPLTGGPSNVCKDNGICSLADAKASENGLPDDTYYSYLTTGGTGQASRVPDARITNVNNLPPLPFQLTGPNFSYDAYAASPVHRFYQMWQQLDCSPVRGTPGNPSGCRSDLFPWVEVTVGAGSNGKPQPSPFTNASTHEGSTSMGFYNVLRGDVPYFKSLADQYAMSDNFHQSVNGGTGANHIMLGTGDAIWFSDGSGHPAMPPHNVTPPYVNAVNAGVVDEIENPNPMKGTNNWYTEDGYGGGGFGSPVFGGGSHSNCSDSSAPGVDPIVDYLNRLQRRVDPRCEPGHYYILNNYNPGYFGDGSNAYTDTTIRRSRFLRPACAISAMRCSKRTSPGNITATNGMRTLPTSISSITERSGPTAISTATSATGFSIRHRSRPIRPCGPRI